KLRDREGSVIRNVLPSPEHRERLGIESPPLALRAGLVELQPLDPGIEHVVLGAGARALLFPLYIVDLQAGAVAGGTPAVLGVVRKQPRVELGEAASAQAAGALGRENLDLLAGQDVDHQIGRA